LSLTAAVNNKGQMHWRVHAGQLTALALITFMRRLVIGARKKVFLLMEDIRASHARSVRVWLVEHVDEIEVFDKPRDRLLSPSRPSVRLDHATAGPAA
jgi:hypothetical protein